MNFELLLTIVVGVIIANAIINNPGEVVKGLASLSITAVCLVGIAIAFIAIYVAYQWVITITLQDVAKVSKEFFGATALIVLFLGPWAAVVYTLRNKGNMTSFITLCSAIGLNILAAKVIMQI